MTARDEHRSQLQAASEEIAHWRRRAEAAERDLDAAHTVMLRVADDIDAEGIVGPIHLANDLRAAARALGVGENRDQAREKCAACDGTGAWNADPDPSIARPCPECGGVGENPPRATTDLENVHAAYRQSEALLRQVQEIHADNGHGWCQGCGWAAGGGWVERAPCRTSRLLSDMGRTVPLYRKRSETPAGVGENPPRATDPRLTDAIEAVTAVLDGGRIPNASRDSLQFVSETLRDLAGGGPPERTP